MKMSADERLYLLNDQALENRIRFKNVAPTIEQLDRVKVLLCGISDDKLEKIWLIPKGTLKRVRYSGRRIPAKFWHMFYVCLKLRDGFCMPPMPKRVNNKLVRPKPSKT